MTYINVKTIIPSSLNPQLPLFIPRQAATPSTYLQILYKLMMREELRSALHHSRWFLQGVDVPLGQPRAAAHPSTLRIAARSPCCQHAEHSLTTDSGRFCLAFLNFPLFSVEPPLCVFSAKLPLQPKGYTDVGRVSAVDAT